MNNRLKESKRIKQEQMTGESKLFTDPFCSLCLRCLFCIIVEKNTTFSEIKNIELIFGVNCKDFQNALIKKKYQDATPISLPREF